MSKQRHAAPYFYQKEIKARAVGVFPEMLLNDRLQVSVVRLSWLSSKVKFSTKFAFLATDLVLLLLYRISWFHLTSEVREVTPQT